jgi:hypothetical protein
VTLPLVPATIPLPAPLVGPLSVPLLGGLSDDPRLARIQVLTAQLDAANIDYERFDAYYSGTQPLAFLAPEVAAQVGGRLAPLVINWPEVIVDSVNRRVASEGFLLGVGATADEELWRIWTANEMHHEAPLGQTDALVHGLTFISVWGNDEDPATPVITFESSHQVAASYVPGTGDRVVRDVVKRWTDDDGTVRVNLYTADAVFKYRSSAQAWGAAGARWELSDVVENPLGAVPFVPMVNRGRLLNRAGRSELASVAPLADGINKLATDMMVTSEFYQSPRRWASGLQMSANPQEREALQAEAAAFWDHAAKQKTLLGGPGVAFGQFPEADLSGFVAAINLLTSALAAIGGLPPDDLGLNQVNPASAEARRAAETVLTLRAREKQSSFGRAYVRAMQLAVAARDGIPLRALPTEFARMSVDWVDPATQAIAQEMDAAQKGLASGIYDIEAAQSRVGMGPTERAAFAQRAAERAREQGSAQQGPQFAQVGLPALVEAHILSREEARQMVGVTGPAPALPPDPVVSGGASSGRPTG